MKNNLKSTGIIVEYNPFHNGHHYHIQQAKLLNPDTILVAVMSPNFVQRGEPAFVEKWERVRAALDHGVDLIVELPTCYAIQSAQYFAKASVEILNLMGVSNIVFGSETGSVDKAFLPNPKSLDASTSLAKNINNTKASNDVLGSLYMYYANQYGIGCHPIKRTNSYTSIDISNPISSATAIRAHISSKDVSHTTPMDLNNVQHHFLNDYEDLIHYRLSLGPETMKDCLMVDEGIENLLYKLRSQPLDSLIEQATNRKYSTSRIRRTLMAIYLDIKKEAIQPIETVRVLGMTNKGQSYLRQLKHDKLSPVVPFKHYQYRDLEIKATTLYSLPYGKEYQTNLHLKELSTLIRID